jgi:hypothetical protein
LPTGPSSTDTQGGIRTHRRPGLSRAARPLAYLGTPARRKPWDSNPQAGTPAARFQDGSLIRPVGFRRVPRLIGSSRRHILAPSSSGGGPSLSRSPRASCGSRTRLSGLGSRCLDRSAKDAHSWEVRGTHRRGSRGGSRTPNGPVNSRVRLPVPPPWNGTSRSRGGRIRTGALPAPDRADSAAFPRPDRSAQRESNPHVRPGEAAGSRYIMGTIIAAELSKSPSAPGGIRTHVAAPRRGRSAPAARRPVPCLRVGPEGLEPSPTRVRAGRAAANTSIPPLVAKSAREESNLRLAVIGRLFSR